MSLEDIFLCESSWKEIPRSIAKEDEYKITFKNQFLKKGSLNENMPLKEYLDSLTDKEIKLLTNRAKKGKLNHPKIQKIIELVG